MKHLLLALTFFIALSAGAITATKDYVDRATNNTLIAAKAYADKIGGVTPNVVTNIAYAVVTNGVADWALKGKDAPISDLSPAINYTTAVSNKLETAIGNTEGYTTAVSNKLERAIGATVGYTTSVSNKLEGAIGSAVDYTTAVSNKLETAIGHNEGYVTAVSNKLEATISNTEGYTTAVSNKLETAIGNTESYTTAVSNKLETAVTHAESYTTAVSNKLETAISNTEGYTTAVSNKLETAIAGKLDSAWVSNSFTNLVAGVVTNDVSTGYTAWTFPSRLTGSEEGDWESRTWDVTLVSNTVEQLQWGDYALSAYYEGTITFVSYGSTHTWPWVKYHKEASQSDSQCELDPEEPSDIGPMYGHMLCTATRTRIYANSLGLAYARDVPSTNGLASADSVSVAIDKSLYASNTVDTISNTVYHSKTYFEVKDSNLRLIQDETNLVWMSDYELTNYLNGATTLSLYSGQIVYDKFTNGIPILTLNIKFPKDSSAAGDALLRLYSAETGLVSIVTVDGYSKFTLKGMKDWNLIPAGDSLMMFTKTIVTNSTAEIWCAKQKSEVE